MTEEGDLFDPKVPVSTLYRNHIASPQLCCIARTRRQRLRCDLEYEWDGQDKASASSALEWPRPAIELAPAELSTALRGRRAPDAAAIASYLLMRQLHSRLVAEVSECLLESAASSTDRRSTMYRRLVAEGPLTPRDWRALLDIVRFVHHVRDHGVERAAYLEGRDPRTMRTRLERLTRSTIAEARFRFGWEWAIESALRRWGYVREDSPSVSRLAAVRTGGR